MKFSLSRKVNIFVCFLLCFAFLSGISLGAVTFCAQNDFEDGALPASFSAAAAAKCVAPRLAYVRYEEPSVRSAHICAAILGASAVSADAAFSSALLILNIAASIFIANVIIRYIYNQSKRKRQANITLK